MATDSSERTTTICKSRVEPHASRTQGGGGMPYEDILTLVDGEDLRYGLFWLGRDVFERGKKKSSSLTEKEEVGNVRVRERNMDADPLEYAL